MRLFACILATLIAVDSWAQAPNISPAQSNQPARAPRRVDQTVADLNALSTSLRYVPTGLREPAGFREVMEVPGRPDLLMRVNGEVYAVFPRSEYSPTQGGLAPTVSANTIFYIGSPPSLELVGRAFPLARNEQSTKVDAAAKANRRQNEITSQLPARRRETPPSPKEPERVAGVPLPVVGDPDAPDKRKVYDVGGPVTIVTDDSYRLWRLQELLQRAAKAEQAKVASAEYPTS